MWYLPLLKANLLPDPLIRAGIRRLLAQRLKEEAAKGDAAQVEKAFADTLRTCPVAAVPEKANEQHYEVPTEFFRLVLGKHLKYSSCLWPEGVDDLDAAEAAMLALTCERAELAGGQQILELGCGWGSLSLYMAETFPEATITSVSNSSTQKDYIDDQARRRGLTNLTVITADMNDFNIGRSFDRVVSVEMFEHMQNYQELLKRIAGWLKPDGKLFVHIFCHASRPYFFTTGEKDDWMARYFFSGGIMPSENLYQHFGEHLRIAHQWRVNGRHYERTLNEWLKRMDARNDEVMPVLRDAYGAEAATWRVYWRVFFMACAELFGYHNGEEWFVAHYLFEKATTISS
ncbi:MAG TPA: cyclopropane-fatty-acyl-phospholipid synthase family protein [Kiritimatiellia bacterium]|nr:cyclopropane-fatty-acyl-phospholipid synthase family protein [Kiritimatiellia bacterium]